MSSSKPSRAVIYRRFGKPDVLEIVEQTSDPNVRHDCVLIRVSAVSINPKDTLLRRGKFNKILAREPLPRGTGFDAAGTVIGVGESVSEFSVGDEVYGMTNRFCGGLLRDFVQLQASEISTAPRSITLENSAAIPLAGLTALQALSRCCDCRPGSRLLILGATGGVGHFATQIAVAMGANVTAVCGSNNREFASSLGAKNGVFYDQQSPTDLESIFDVVFDVSGKYEPKQFAKQLGRAGVFISTVPKFSSVLGELLARMRISERSRLVIVNSNSNDLNRLVSWVDEGRVTPFVSKVYDIKDIQHAHQDMQSGHTQGKLVVKL